MKNHSKLLVTLAFAIQMLCGGFAIAQEKTPAAPDDAKAVDAPAKPKAQKDVFSLELNGAKDTETGCRLTYVAYNGTGAQLDKTAYEVVVFDKEGSVSQFLILEFGKLPLRKTKVVQFELKDSKCADISRLLINDVSECEVNGQTVSTCFDALTTKSRTNIGFGT
jgi:hypothetical protein